MGGKSSESTAIKASDRAIVQVIRGHNGVWADPILKQPVSSSLCRLRLRRGAGVVCRACGPHHPPVRCPQTGHLGRVLRGDPSSEEPRGQNARGAEQGRPD